jgi:hypothetical protein
MFLKNLFCFIFILCISNCFAQDTVEKSNHLTNDVTEKFSVLKSDGATKQGLYAAYYRRKSLIVKGNFDMGKKAGQWFFYSPTGVPLEVFDYDKNVLRYEAHEDTKSYLRYLIDKELTDSDRVSKPIKIGGRYFGYLPYLGLYRTPLDVDAYTASSFVAVIELLVSPLGRLADYKVRLVSDLLQYDQTTHMDINLFSEEDKEFLPATLNGEPILSRIVIKCRLLDGGKLDFF